MEEDVNFEKSRIQNWSQKPEQISHKAMAILVELHKKNIEIDKEKWTQIVNKVLNASNPKGTVASFATNAGKNYGRVTYFEDGIVKLSWPEYTMSFDWIIPEAEMLKVFEIIGSETSSDKINNYTWLPFFEELLDKICKNSNSEELYNHFKQFLPDKWNDIAKIDPLSYICCINGGSKVFFERCKIAKETFNLSSDMPKDNNAIPAFPNGNYMYIYEFYKTNDIDSVMDDLWAFAKKINNSNLDAELFDKIVNFDNIGVGKLSQFLYICKPNEYYSCDGTMLSFLNHKLSGKDYNAFQEVQKKGKSTGISPYELSMQAWNYKAKLENNNNTINKLRSDLLNYGQELTATISETGDYTALKLIKNIAEVHKVRNNKFRVLVSYDALDTELKAITEKVPDSYQWTLNASFYVDSQETLEQAKSLIENIVNKQGKGLSKAEEPANRSSNDMNKNIPLNQILFGPPGTGKTYETRNIIKGILQEQVDKLNNEYNTNDELKLKEVVESLTWYDVIALAMYRNSQQNYKVKDIANFPEIKAYYELKNCKQLNNTLWGQLQIHTGLDSSTVKYSPQRRSEPFVFDKTENAEWYLTEAGKKYVQEELADSLKKLTGKKEHKLEDFYKFITFHQSYSYEEFVEGLKPEVNEETGNITYNIENGIFKDICKDARRDMGKGLKYVLVIDEINRGNISKIFGELITLIEDTKRIKLNPQEDDEGLEATLPYSKQLFGVPENLYIVGTMNTADRSIALLDIALRRRFEFIAKYPDSSIIQYGTGKTEIEGINLEEFLNAINERIEVLYDKDHTIGHSYLMGISDYPGFLKAFNNKILPLLQEYFYNDYEKIAKVLNQNSFDENDTAIIHKAEVMNIPKFSINPKLLNGSGLPSDAFKRACLKND